MTTTASRTGSTDHGNEPDDMSARITANVRILRAHRDGMSERALALAAGMSQARLNRRTTGAAPWDGPDVIAVARALRVQWAWLMLPTVELLQRASDVNRPTTEYPDKVSQIRRYGKALTVVTQPAHVRDDVAA